MKNSKKARLSLSTIPEKLVNGELGIDCFNDDIMKIILGRLPAKSFAFATCVNKTWYRVCSQILVHPKLVSALSCNPSLTGAVEEVSDKVLSKPIRPSFAIACISEKDGLKLVHQLLSRKLGARTPLVTHISNGVMGKDALTNQLKDVKWDYFNYNGPHPRESEKCGDANQGIILIVGYLPGFKVDTIPLYHPKKRDINMDLEIHFDNFVKEIKAYSAACHDEFPKAIIMFGDRNSDVHSIVTKMDHAMPDETAIVGDAGGCFLFNSLNFEITIPPYSYTLDVVALVLAEDKHKTPDEGKTEFHVVTTAGLVPCTPQFEVVEVLVEPSTKTSMVKARLEGRRRAIVNVKHFLEGVHAQSHSFYIALTPQRKSGESSGSLARSTTFYPITRTQGSFFVVDGVGIKQGDIFILHFSDSKTVEETNMDALYCLQAVRDRKCSKNQNVVLNANAFGGLIFSCHSRGDFDNISPFVTFFPKVPVAGVYCKGEIGRGGGSSDFIPDEEKNDPKFMPVYACIHSCSAVYLVMTHTPALSSSSRSLLG